MTLTAGRPILVGMEATGHYGEALKRFLAANGVPYAEYNPAGVLSFAKSRGTHHKKTDRADAAAIAAFASSSPPSATTTSYHPNGLKCLVRHRRSLVVRRAACWNRVAKSLDVVFPEFVGFLGKGDASAGRKAPLVALGHVAKRLLRVIWALETEGGQTRFG